MDCRSSEGQAMSWIRPPEGKITEHFSWHEAACRHCGLVPSIEEVRKTAEWLEKVRAALGRPMKVLSWCRCPKHNRAVGGAPNSYHLRGWAVDFTCKDLSPLHVRGDRLHPNREKLAIGGLGCYAGFTHIDRRKKQATWAEDGVVE